MRTRISRWGRGPWSLPLATFLGLIENTLIIVPMEPVFMPLMVLRRKQAWLIAAALLLGNVLGGLIMYWLGAVLAEDVIQPLFAMTDATEAYEISMERMQSDGFATLFMIGVTPFPFQVGAAAAGAAAFSIPLFILVVTLSRAIRYFAEAALVMLVGERAEDILKRHELELLIFGVLLFAAFVVFYLLF